MVLLPEAPALVILLDAAVPLDVCFGATLEALLTGRRDDRSHRDGFGGTGSRHSACFQ